MEPEHITLKRQFNSIDEPTYEQLTYYIEITKVGEHFSFYAMGRKPTSEMFIKLYTNNNTFKEWCDRFPALAIDFLNKNCLVQAANLFVTEQYKDYCTKQIALYALRHQEDLSPILFKTNKILLLKNCKNASHYQQYMKFANMSKNAEKRFIDKLLKEVDIKIVSNLIKDIRNKENQEYLQAMIGVQMFAL